jgi:hypothetical protein
LITTAADILIISAATDERDKTAFKLLHPHHGIGNMAIIARQAPNFAGK